MNTFTTVLAAASSDQQLIDTIDRVAGKGATWWLAGLGVILMGALVFLFRSVINQNRELMAELKSANAAQADDLRKVIVANTVAMSNVSNAMTTTAARLDDLEKDRKSVV